MRSGACEKMTDEEIAQRASKERFLFGIIVDRYATALERYIRRLGVSNQEDIHDIVQDTFLKTYRNLQQFDIDLKFSSWLYRIAHNETMSFFRRTNIRPEAHYVEDMEKTLDLIRSDIDIEESAQKSFDVKKVMGIVEGLESRLRYIIVLRYLEQKSYREISDILHVPEGTVATLLHKAKKKIKKAFE
ncbi:MAG: RNA polymerase sigma factor [Patescibacteria group bacterium]